MGRKSKRNERLGVSKYMNCGSLAIIVKYNNANDMIIQFEDGTIVENVAWHQWEKGEILNRSIKHCSWMGRKSKMQSQSRLGETRMMNCGVEGTIIEYNNVHDISVQFPDGSVNYHKNYGEFIKGEIQCPSLSKLHNCSRARSLNCKARREGLREVMNCGMECEVIEYRNAKSGGITVRFSDGKIVVGSWNNFKKHSIHNANLPKCNCVNNSLGEQEIAEILCEYNIPFERQKTFDDLKSSKNSSMFFDFYLPTYNLLIEYQGEFHDGIPYLKNPNGIQTKNDFDSLKERDVIKKDWAKKHNIRLLEIWYYEKENMENIIKEGLYLC